MDGYGYSDGGYFALLAAFGFFIFLIAVAGYVIGSWFLMKIFDKAGVQGRWRAWVPFYNLLVFSKLGDVSPWVMLIAIAAAAVLGGVPVLNVVVSLLPLAVGALAAWRVGLKLQKETPWVILYVFLSVVWLGINAFDGSRWNPAIPPAPWAGNGFLADRTVWQGIPQQSPGYAAPYGAPGYQAPGYQNPGQAPGYQTQPAPPQSAPPAPPAWQPPVTPPAAQPPVTPPASPPSAQPPTSPPSAQPPASPPPAPPAPDGDAPRI